MNETKVSEKVAEGQAGIIEINEAKIHGHLDEVVRSTVEETLNGMLEAEAEGLVGAGRYERTEERRDTRAGHYERNLDTKAGRVKLKMPKLRKLTFETAIVERYRRRESSVEEALIEMYLAGVSVRRVEDITEALWGTRVSSGTVSRLNQKIYGKIEQWRMRPLEGEHPMVYLDGISMKRTWGRGSAQCIDSGGHRRQPGRVSGGPGRCGGGKGRQGELDELPEVFEGSRFWRISIRRFAGSAVWCIGTAMSSRRFLGSGALNRTGRFQDHLPAPQHLVLQTGFLVGIDKHHARKRGCRNREVVYNVG